MQAVVMLLTCVLGCSTTVEPAAPTPVPKTDDVLATDCVEAWLREQEAARSGEEYWDQYARTPLKSPNSSPYAKAILKAYTSVSELQTKTAELKAEVEGHMFAQRPKTIRIPETVVERKNLHAVRSWKVLGVQVLNDDEKRRAFTQRDETAKVQVRVDSSNVDGSPITKTWTVSLFKEDGRWGIYSLDSPSSN